MDTPNAAALEQSSGVHVGRCAAPQQGVWHEENGSVSTVWSVLVDYGVHSTTFWFYNKDAAERFVAHVHENETGPGVTPDRLSLELRSA